MKLGASFIITQAVASQANPGGCDDCQTSRSCVTTCDFTPVGRKGSARQKFYFEGPDSVTTRLSASHNGLNDEELKDYRFLMRFDRQQCGKKILDGLEAGDLKIEVSDYSNLYSLESIYWNKDQCKSWQQALYMQWRHQNPNGERDWVYNKVTDKHKDLFYVTMYGLRNIEESVGATRAEAVTCMEKIWTDRMNEVGAENADYTKCVLYNKCSLEPDWTAGVQAECTTTTTTPTTTSTTTTSTTTTSTTTTTTTTTPTTTTTTSDLPDYNNDEYTFTCDTDTSPQECTLTMTDGQQFKGINVEGVINFRAIPFAQAPIGDLRWKAPELITHYDTPVDATQSGYGCATFQTVDDPEQQNQSEDCLHVNVQVPKWMLDNRRKMPMVAFIHGGAFNFGTNEEDLSSLAKQGMTVVNINYRLGPYGFLYLDDVEDGQVYKGNWGLMDQLAGLKWISMYGGVFGGNKDQVTLDGCSAGSQSEWHHITSPDSWPYFNQAVTTGIGFPAGIYYEGTKTDLIRNTVFDHAGVSSIDELRQLSTGTLRDSFLHAKNTLSPSIKSAPTLDAMYGPVIDGVMLEDHLVYMVRDGKIRPNTPISLNYAKEDAWNFVGESFMYMTEVLFKQWEADIDAAEEATGFEVPAPYPNMMLEAMYPSHADRLKEVFVCEENTDCKEGFFRFIQATHWYCNTRWAMNGELKQNPSNYGPFYPMQFGVPNCDKIDGVNTKTCHCSEGPWVRGSRTWGAMKDLGTDMKNAWGNFYKTGLFSAESNVKSWEDMEFNKFNLIDNNSWVQDAVLNWSECDLLDEIHDLSGDMYTWGYTWATPDGPNATPAPSTTAIASTTVEPTQPGELPDYNNDEYTFSCDETDTCTLTMTDGQTFIGKKDGGMVSFKAIPYAKPPTGSRRWKSPELVTHYDETVDATTEGMGCATFQTVDDPTVQNQSEDCLHVNIQVPEWVLKNRRKMPMVAFIHGGAFNFGDNGADQSSLASQGMAVVSINYRLGPYGFLYLDQLEEGQTYKGNWGLQDQLAGLKWISMYGGVFGGDSQQVTIDGCSAGSQSGWHHLTSPDSWDYFHRAVTTGIGLPAGIYYEGTKTDTIRNTVLEHAGVSTIDELRGLSTGTLRNSFVHAKNTLSPSMKSAPTLDPTYAPVIDGVMIEDHLVYMVRDGRIRPNTPIALSYAKDDAWTFTEEAWTFMKDVLFASVKENIVDAEVATGFTVPAPWPHTMFETMYAPEAEALKQVFVCEDNTDCLEGFARWVQATHWYCNTRWAFNGALKTDSANYGPVYPMQFGIPNCDPVDDVNTKTCHCSEGAWVRGGRTWGEGAGLGTEMKQAYGNFYKNGAFATGGSMHSWEEMDFNKFNLINVSEDGTSYDWIQAPVLEWAECDILDQVQERTGDAYTFGYTKENQNGPGA